MREARLADSGLADHRDELRSLFVDRAREQALELGQLPASSDQRHIEPEGPWGDVRYQVEEPKACCSDSVYGLQASHFPGELAGRPADEDVTGCRHRLQARSRADDRAANRVIRLDDGLAGVDSGPCDNPLRAEVTGGLKGPDAVVVVRTWTTKDYE